MPNTDPSSSVRLLPGGEKGDQKGLSADPDRPGLQELWRKQPPSPPALPHLPSLLLSFCRCSLSSYCGPDCGRNRQLRAQHPLPRGSWSGGRDRLKGTSSA